MYVCDICHKEYSERNSYAGHRSRCTRKDIKLFSPGGWNKGLTKNDHAGIASSARKLSTLSRLDNRVRYLSEYWNNLSPEGWHIFKEKCSISMKKQYSSGRRIPSRKGGYAKKSIFHHKNENLLLRSSYEFIFACYLVMSDKVFSYEKIKVSSEGHTYISDFVVDNNVFEVRGIIEEYDILSRSNAFLTHGYSFHLISQTEIEFIRISIQETGFNINDYLKVINDNQEELYIFDSSVLPISKILPPLIQW